MKFLILSDMFSLDSWLIENQDPKIMPAVYEFFQYIGKHQEHSFHAIIINSKVNKTIRFDNGSSIQLYRSRIPFHYIRKLYSLNLQKRIAQKWIENNKVDVVYGMSIYSIVARKLGRKNHILSVGRLFGSLVYDVIQKKQWFKLYTRYILQYLEANKPCDLTICTEDGTQFDLAIQKINPKHKLQLLYNGINSQLKRELLNLPEVKILKSIETRILYSGRLTNWKRQDIAINAIDYLINHYGHQNIQMTVLGRGENEERIRKMIQQRKLQEYIKVLSPVDHKEIPKVLSQHQVFLSMYDASNLSNSIWEAALAGRLICTRNTGKTGEVYKDGENAIVAKDAKSMAIAIHRMINQDVSEITANARQQIDQLIPSWEDRFEKEFSIIKEKLKKK